MSEQIRHRAKRNERLHPPPQMRLTERDIEIINAVYEYRLLSQAQIRRLLFDGKNPNTANRRLFLLYHNGYLDRRFLLQSGGILTSETLYILDRKGRDTLIEYGWHKSLKWESRQYPTGSQKIPHLLHMNTFRIEVMQAVQEFSIECDIWLDDTTLHQDYDRVYVNKGQKAESIIPDGYFQLRLPEHKPMHFFLELDNDNMSIPRFQHKIQKYLAWETSGKLFARFQTKNYRVLTVTPSAKRMHKLREATSKVGGKKRFWFSNLTDTLASMVLTQPVWWICDDPNPVTLVNGL